MKRNLGAKPALYPVPIVVVGAFIKGKPNWCLLGHQGPMGIDMIMLSSGEHYTNLAIKESKVLSVALVTEDWLNDASYVGEVSGKWVDKSDAFEYEVGELGAPIIKKAKLVMECSLVSVEKVDGFENFLCQIVNTLVDDSILDQNGLIDYKLFKPVLFEYPNYAYVKTGEVIGPASQSTCNSN